MYYLTTTVYLKTELISKISVHITYKHKYTAAFTHAKTNYTHEIHIYTYIDTNIQIHIHICKNSCKVKSLIKSSTVCANSIKYSACLLNKHHFYKQRQAENELK